MKLQVTRIFLAVLTLIVVNGCGTQPQNDTPTQDALDEFKTSIMSPKGDSFTKYQTRNLGPLNYDVVIGQVGDSVFDGFELELQAGDTFSVLAQFHYFGFVSIYGPRVEDGEWGNPSQFNWANADASAPESFEYHTTLRYVTESSGTYFVVVGAPFSHHKQDYRLHPRCNGGPCMP